ncbi:hypothetical protein IJ21_08030 [Paenibacillus sp. 32O-W]|jgi:Ferric iron reductase FhuF-like transporter./FhuF 2Fe-2S C-terminal domain.|uniref:(2Fe-2S)-binding protein n=1 Tax=Paenibacillus sp. 32O-W TaxID=1695218 RepID=UPI0007211E84|nr:(2Fe-2S)-binding protein [Paenibacillus sp. 32O-W]ALS26219.1 hypothetical protein IJ21_08030 [Paenibacillus sp. 32O-W]
MKVPFSLLETHCYVYADRPNYEAGYETQLDRLLSPEEADRFANWYGNKLQASDRTPAATYFVSWLRGFAGAAMTTVACGATLDWSLSNWSVLSYEQGGYTRFAFYAHDSTVIGSPEVGRERWMQEQLDGFFGRTLAPLFRSLSQAVSVPEIQLWRLQATGLQYFVQYAEKELNASDAAALRRLSEYITAGMSPAHFGLRTNPLHISIRMIDNPYEPGGQIAMKAACCLAFKVGGSGYCYTCPRLTSRQRSLMKEKILAGQQA